MAAQVEKRRNHYILCLFPPCTTTYSVPDSSTVDYIVYIAIGATALLGLVSVALSLKVAKLCMRSIPQAHTEALGACRTEFAQLRNEFYDIQQKVGSWRIELENLMEAVEGSLELAERKRKSMATSASKLAAAQAQAESDSLLNHSEAPRDPLTLRRDLEREARKRGLI